MIHGEFGKNLSVESDIGLFESWDELRVAHAVLLEECRHAHIPKAAEIALFVAAMSESVGTSMENRFIGLAFLGGATETIALHFAKDIFSSFKGINAFLYS